MVSFYGILAQFTFARVAARHLAKYKAMCAVNWWNSLHKQTQTQTDTPTYTHTYTHTCTTTTSYIIYTAPNAHSCTTMATYVQCSTRI